MTLCTIGGGTFKSDGFTQEYNLCPHACLLFHSTSIYGRLTPQQAWHFAMAWECKCQEGGLCANDSKSGTTDKSRGMN